MAELPRSALVARFGEEGAGSTPGPAARRRSASGRAGRRSGCCSACRSTHRPRASRRSGSSSAASRGRSPTSSSAPGRGGGLARLVVTHDLAFARRGTPETLRFEQRFPEPTADAEAIERLLVARLGEHAAAGRGRRAGAGARGWWRPAAGQQPPLFVPQAARDARLAWQLARLAIAFGADRIRRVELDDPEAPLAERRWRWRPVAGTEVLARSRPPPPGGPHVPETIP